MKHRIGLPAICEYFVFTPFELSLEDGFGCSENEMAVYFHKNICPYLETMFIDGR